MYGDQEPPSGKPEYGDLSDVPRRYRQPSASDGCLDYALSDGLRVRVYLIADTTSIGRASSADCTVEDSSVSEKHAEVIRSNGEYFIRAAPGGATYINGTVISPGTPVPIHSGDTIRLANLRMTFIRSTALSGTGSHFPARTSTD